MNSRLHTSPSPFTRKSVLGSACALLVACGAESEAQPGGPDVTSLAGARLQLERATSCDELLTRIQDSIIVQLQQRAEQLAAGEEQLLGEPGIGIAVDEDPALPPRDAIDAPAAPVPTGSSGDDASPGTAAPGPAAEGERPSENGGSFSGTTVQVEDVDEADIVKTEGDRIYLLHGGTLFVLRGWPADATEILGSALVEGAPLEMFVDGGRAVVFSRVYDLPVEGAREVGWRGSAYTKLSVLDVSEGTPRLVRESFIEGEYASSRRHGEVVRAVIEDGFKLPRLDAPVIEYRDGFGKPFPQADIDAQVQGWLARTTRSVRATELGDWLPRELGRQGGELVPVAPRCADHYSPAPGLTESGVTSVVALDLADVSAPLSGATILGRAERVYANDQALLLTQTDYRYAFDSAATEQTVIHRFDLGARAEIDYVASGAVPGRINDQFSLDERDGVIRVSTTIQPSWGFVGQGRAVPVTAAPPPVPTALPTTPASGGDDAPVSDGGDGAPIEGEQAEEKAAPAEVEPMPDPAIAPPPPEPGSVPVSRVLTLVREGDALLQLGASEDFGHNEQIFATRFLGDRGYVVTFRRTDPLFVLDLSDPADPRVVGELHIPGFSNYLFPLDEDHLFAIGQDATEEGVVRGLALQVFDVSDPTRPTLAAKHVYASQGDSPANVDHRAITFHPERSVVALPHQSYETGESTLDLFEVRADAIAPLGSVGMSDPVDLDACLVRFYGPLPAQELDALKTQLASDPGWQRELLASCGYGRQFRRGVFRDDFVYGISNTGMYVYDMTQMGAGAVSTLSLPAEVYDAGRASDGGGVEDIAPLPAQGTSGASPGVDVAPSAEPGSAAPGDGG